MTTEQRAELVIQGFFAGIVFGEDSRDLPYFAWILWDKN